MADEIWGAVDAYLTGALHEPDPVLDEALAKAKEAGLPPIQVSATQGKLLHILARMIPARRVLEVGTLGGYSTIWMARALPEDGRIISLEINPAHAEVARANLERAGLASVAEVRLGRAIESLEAISAEGGEPFDLVFIDADKRSNADYFARSLELTRPGSVIVVDNVVRQGTVIEDSDDPDVSGVRQLFELMQGEKRVTATAIQTVGAKSYDGFAIALVN